MAKSYIHQPPSDSVAEDDTSNRRRFLEAMSLGDRSVREVVGSLTPSREQGHDANDLKRRHFMKAVTAAGVGGMASLAGCGGSQSGDGDGGGGDGSGSGVQTTEGGGENLVPVHDVQIDGEAPERGIIYEAYKFAFDSLDESLPINFEYNAQKHSTVVEKVAYANEYGIGTLYYTVRPHRLDPHMFLYNANYSGNVACGARNWGDYRDEYMDELLEGQRTTFDREERREYIQEIQAELASVGGNAKFGWLRPMYSPILPQVVNTELWDNVTHMRGLGIRNYWNWNGLTPKTDQTELVVPLSIEASNMSPLIGQILNLTATRQVYSRLTRTGPDFTPQPDLAEDWDISDDNLEITFHLRENHTWHDGEPVTAEDVAFTYEYMTEHSPNFATATRPITTTEVIDDTTVKLGMDEAFSPAFIFSFNRVPIIPQHIWEKVPDEVGVDDAFRYSPVDNDEFIGSGHFKFEHWRKAEEVKLVANEDHYATPEADAMIIRVIKNTGAIISELENGSSHLLWEFDGDPQVLEDLTEENDHLEFYPTLSIGNYPLLMSLATAPFMYEEVRAASESVIPKETIAREIWGGFAEPVYGDTMVDFWYNDDQKKWSAEETGREEAMRVLKDAGFTERNGQLYYPPGEDPPETTEWYGCEKPTTAPCAEDPTGC